MLSNRRRRVRPSVCFRRLPIGLLVAGLLFSPAVLRAETSEEGGEAPGTTAAPHDHPHATAHDHEGAHDHPHGFHDHDVEAGPPRERVYSFGLDELVVTASPLPRKASELAGAVSTLTGTELLQRQQPTLGETVKNLPGVSSTYNGPGASRPILRGLGGSRVQILQDHLAVIDASAASNDHAVAVDTLGLERVEILRGPATLRYGPNAIGGVVNTIERRIPRAVPDELLGGSVELRGSSVDGGFGGAAVLAGGSGQWAYRLKGFGFTAGDVSIPGCADAHHDDESGGAAESDHADEDDEECGVLPNSQVNLAGFSSGFAWIGDKFHIGAAPSYFRTDYGVVGHAEHHEEDEAGSHDEEEELPISVDLESWSLDLAAGVSELGPQVHSLEALLRLTDYEHVELEGDEAATRFRNRGWDLRLELVQERIGILEGAVGFQSTFSDFDVSGEEAFLPTTRTAVESLFFIEEIDLAPVIVEFGGRFDYTTVRALESDVFGPGRRRNFAGGSAAVGVVGDVTPDQTLSLDLSWSRRAPNYEELFADGVHVANGVYEIGDADLGAEAAIGLNVGWLGQFAVVDWSMNFFYDRFDDFVFLEETGAMREGVPEARFLASEAAFVGGEIEIAGHVLDLGDHRLHIIGRADYVHAQNLDADEALPRIPPLRFGGSLVWEFETFRAEFDAIRAMAQERVPAGEETTPGYTMLDLDFSWVLDRDALGIDVAFEPQFFFGIHNLLNAEARDAASFLREVAPLPGRNFTGGVRATF